MTLKGVTPSGIVCVVGRVLTTLTCSVRVADMGRYWDLVEVVMPLSSGWRGV